MVPGVAGTWPLNLLFTRTAAPASNSEHSISRKVFRMPTGTVKWFDATAKKFGFIARSDDGPDVFVHISAVEAAGLRTLEPGQAIEFTIETNEKTRRSCAERLRLL